DTFFAKKYGHRAIVLETVAAVPGMVGATLQHLRCLREMRDDGVRRALCLVTSAFSSYSGCRQYREDLAAARAEVGDDAPELDKVRVYYNHPGFVTPQIGIVERALAMLPDEVRGEAHLVFTTHSIPRTMSRHSDYEVQHHETCRLVAEAFPGRPWQLVYNSRSGPEHVPWLEPDVNDHLEHLAADGVRAVVVVPIGFVSDHMEVIYDLDTEAAATAQAAGLPFVRAATAGTHPRFVAVARELLLERAAVERGAAVERPTVGDLGPSWDRCPPGCCANPGGERPALCGRD
ncbi:MAG: ferrochelatase, partial [Nocardioides sp.]|nr:ferrochelatase [Nocardioides sp.]